MLASPEQVRFSPDGSFLLGILPARVLDNDGKLKGVVTVMDAHDGHELQSWQTGTRGLECGRCRPRHQVVASGGEDRMIHLWDVASGGELAHWPAHEGDVTALSFSRDGATLFSGSRDGALKVWNLPFIRKELAALGLDW